MFVVYAVDESAARHGRRRVSERKLLLVGAGRGFGTRRASYCRAATTCSAAGQYFS
ncbi:DUF1294 domain-containing protein [Frondihabitans sucicola]|uniref:DUF1294 domain-containing protein n=1 Tax=Frondihabitans sucicola TaxID=1268041 RepID=UPI0033066F76